ncbi:MAG: hypothetical protein ACR2I9_04515 [Candidatus Nanopelagicaceae bacterium]|jgi:hypothetical protein
MKRRTFDKIVTIMGLGLTVFLFVAAGLLNFGYNFADKNVRDALVAQKVSFPEADSGAMMALPDADQKAMMKYAGQVISNGDMANTYANHYIGVHLKGIAGGKVYEEVSGEFMAKSAQLRANPNDQALVAEVAKLEGQRMSLFMGETLKGLLGFSYAFWQFGQIAKISAGVALGGGIIMLLLTIAGYLHLRRTDDSATI